MGVTSGLFCASNPTQPAPNPRPDRYELIGMFQFQHAHLLVVKYLDCTNFEGHKLMVFEGQYKPREYLDPHFSNDGNSPIARFKPDYHGYKLAVEFAENYKG